MIRATIGIFSQGGVAFDADAQAFFDRVDTAGGTLSATEQAAVNQLVLDMKADGIWSKMKAIYPMVGASAAACAQNLKSSSFTAVFSTSWNFSSAGIENTSNAGFMNTNLIPSNELSLNSVHFSNYFPNLLTEKRVHMGCRNSSQDSLYSYWNYDASIKAIIRINQTSNTFISSIAGASGFNIATRTASTSSKVYVNNSTTATSTSASVALPDINMYIGSLNNNGSANDGSRSVQSFASIGDGLTDTEASDFYDAVQAFQTTLSREV